MFCGRKAIIYGAAADTLFIFNSLKTKITNH